MGRLLMLTNHTYENMFSKIISGWYLSQHLLFLWWLCCGLDPASILGSPCDEFFVPSQSLCHKITIYLTNVYRKSFTLIQPLLPHVMPCWGKSCIAGGGDKVVTRWAQTQWMQFRDGSFVRVSILWLLLLLCLLISHSMKLLSIQILEYGAKPLWWSRYAMGNFMKSSFVKYQPQGCWMPSCPSRTSSHSCQTVKFTLTPLWPLQAMLQFPIQLHLHWCPQFVGDSLSTLLWASDGL